MLSITVGWEWALGIVGMLVVFAWRASARFTALETSMEWMKETLKDLKTGADNAANPAFGSRSPVNLNSTGESWLLESGLKEFVDSRGDYFVQQCDQTSQTNPYEVQKHAFKIFDEIPFDPAFEDQLKKFAFEKGTTPAVLRRVGGIYLRNRLLEHFGMVQEDIDKHDPDITSAS